MLPRVVAGAVVGRVAELARLRELLADVGSGRGRAVLVGGEPGIGKSALLAASVAEAPVPGCAVAWADADELSQRFPLRVLRDLLVGTGRQLATAAPGGLIGDADPVRAASDELVAVVERWCAETPLVLVLDDLQWADEASLAVWQRLAETAVQLPLLLLGAYRPVPHRDAVDRLRQAVEAGDGVVVTLAPLAGPATDALVTDLVGARPGAGLRQLADRAAGNPLYLRELVDVLRHEGMIRVGPDTADLAGPIDRAPASLAAAVARRLGFLSPAATEVLQIASLLGARFSTAEIAAVLGRDPSTLAPAIAEATAVGTLVETGGRLAYRHPLVRQALYEGMAPNVRAALHRHAAKALAEAAGPPAGTPTGEDAADPVDVAGQLAAAPGVLDPWSLDWLAAHAAALVDQAPQIADELLRRAVDQVAPDDPRHAVLASSLAGLLFRWGNNADAEAYATSAITGGDEIAARMRFLAAYAALRTGRVAEAVSGLAAALDEPGVPEGWQARLLALSAMIQAGTGGDLDGAEKIAHEALAIGEAAGDRYAAGFALHALSTAAAVRRDETGRLGYVDRALDLIGDDPDCTDLRLLHLANRMYSLSVLDRMADADATLVTLRTLAERIGDARLVSFHHPAATLYFFLGRWDDALAELDAIPPVLEDSALTGMVHGLAALVAARRDDRAAASAHLAAVRDEPLDTPRARANSLSLLTARAVTAERDGDQTAALEVLRPLLGPEWAQSERHLLLPELARLAVTVGDVEVARQAVETCTAIVAADPTDSRRAAVLRCRGMADGDPAPVLAAADHYRRVGRVPELGQTLEDAAVLLAGRGDVEAARTAFAEAAEAYTGLGAAWDLRRADARVRPFGIRRGSRGPRRRPAHGWAALTTTERLVADLVATGRSNPDIAAELLLSRRTVQSHVSHILAKLGARSRVEIAREAVRQAGSPVG